MLSIKKNKTTKDKHISQGSSLIYEE